MDSSLRFGMFGVWIVVEPHGFRTSGSGRSVGRITSECVRNVRKQCLEARCRCSFIWGELVIQSHASRAGFAQVHWAPAKLGTNGSYPEPRSLSSRPSLEGMHRGSWSPDALVLPSSWGRLKQS